LPPPSAPGGPQDAAAAAVDLEVHVANYLRRTVDSFDLSKSIDVSTLAERLVKGLLLKSRF